MRPILVSMLVTVVGTLVLPACMLCIMAKTIIITDIVLITMTTLVMTMMSMLIIA